MGKMASMAQAHGKYGITWLKHGEIYSHISLGSGVGLDIDVFCVKKFLCPFNCETFNNIGIFTAAVVPSSRISFCIFIRKDRTLNFQYGRACVVFRGYENNILPFPLYLFLYCFENLRICEFEMFKVHVFLTGPLSVLSFLIYCRAWNRQRA